jgi:hypothetical protein
VEILFLFSLKGKRLQRKAGAIVIKTTKYLAPNNQSIISGELFCSSK